MKKPIVYFISLVIGSILAFSSLPPFNVAAATSGGRITGAGNKCLDNAFGRIVNNNKIQLNACSNATNQKWTWTGDGTLRVQGNCLNIRGGAIASGTPVQLYQCNGSLAQQWTLKANGVIASTASGLCLGTASTSTANGTAVGIYTCNASAGRIWNITAAVVPLPVVQPSTHAPLPAGTRLTAKPIITLDTVGAPEYAPWMQQVLKPLLEQWYPVLGDYFANPDYIPPTAFTVKVDPAYTGLAYTSGGNIVVGAAYFRDKLGTTAPGALIHETVHVITARVGGNLPSWISEGQADFARERIYNDRAPRAATANETYLDGYSPGANLLYYAQFAYSPGLVHAVNVAAYTGTYNDSIFVQRTGKTIGALWTGMTGQYITSPGAITNGATGRCFDLPNYATANGTRIKIQTCNGANAEKWVFVGTGGTTTTGVVKGYVGNKCLDVSGSDTANGAVVQYWDCNYGNGQTWTRQADGSFLNVHAGKCLQPVGGLNAEGAMLEIFTCNTTAVQKWNFPL